MKNYTDFKYKLHRNDPFLREANKISRLLKGWYPKRVAESVFKEHHCIIIQDRGYTMSHYVRNAKYLSDIKLITDFAEIIEYDANQVLALYMFVNHTFDVNISKFRNLKFLTLNIIDDLQGKIVEFIRSINGIEHISLECNHISNEYLWAIVNLLKHTNNIQSLRLSCIFIDNSSNVHPSLAIALKSNQSIRHLELPLLSVKFLNLDVNDRIEYLKIRLVNSELSSFLTIFNNYKSLRILVLYGWTIEISENLIQALKTNQSIQSLTLNVKPTRDCDLLLDKIQEILLVNKTIVNLDLRISIVYFRDSWKKTKFETKVQELLEPNRRLLVNRNLRLIEIAARCYAKTHKHVPNPEIIPTEMFDLLCEAWSENLFE